MLQKYKFLSNHSVNELHKEVTVFMCKIKTARKGDIFDPDKYFSKKFAALIKKKTKAKKGLVNSKLFTHFEVFFDKYKVLGPQKRAVDNIYQRMNDITGLFNTKGLRKILTDLPTSIQKEAHKLFVFLYEETLTSYGINKHYTEFCKKQGNNWCPFCGMEQLVHCTHQKEDYDHLLAKSIYPFAAVNMKNLVPMGQKCNRTHKKKKDLIWNNNKHIKAVSPYSSQINISIVFNGTTLPDPIKKKAIWKVEVAPNKAEVVHWNCVFNISDRIIKDYLTNGKESEFNTWLNDYLNENRGKDLNTAKKVRASLIKHGKRFDVNRYRSARYIQADLFKWMGKNAPDTFIDALINSLNPRRKAS